MRDSRGITSRRIGSTVSSAWAPSIDDECFAMKLVGKPDAGNPHVRLMTGKGNGAHSNASPRPSSTLQVTGRKRHILVDTLGLLLGVSVSPANIQDRDGACGLLRGVRPRFPFIEKIYADAGYQGPKMARVVASPGVGKSRSSNARTCAASSSCQKGGSSKGRSHGSVAIDALRVISNVTQPPSPPLFVLP